MKITLDRALLEQAIKSIDKAFDFDGDVFGRMHNDTTDVLQALRAALANAEQAQPQGDRAELIAKLRGSVYTPLRPDQLNMIAAAMLEADHIPDAGKMVHCERCGAELMSDMTNTCYQCNQD